MVAGVKEKTKENEAMLLQGMVLSGQVMESTFYDQLTGQPKPGLSVQLTVLDVETDEKYQCQVSEGFSKLGCNWKGSCRPRWPRSRSKCGVSRVRAASIRSSAALPRWRPPSSEPEGRVKA